MNGGGGDIWNAADQFNYCYTNGSSYGVIIALVTGVQATDGWAKAGVMYRDDTTAGAMFAMVVATSGNGVNFQWRNSTGGQCGNSAVAGVNAPVWVKLVRNGNDFAGYYSPDAAAWSPIGPNQTIPLISAGLAGLAVTAHNDALLNTSTFSNVTVSNTPPAPPPVFGVYRQLWSNLNSGIGDTLDALTNTTYNPDWPDNPNSAYTKVYTSFETEANTGMYNYGERLRAFVVPPASGNYIFWIASDDTSELFLSTDETPANNRQMASVSGWTNLREWSKYAEQQSAPVALEAGRRYYVEAIMEQGGGGDNLSVGWQLPNGMQELPMTAVSAGGTLLIPYTGTDSQVGIYFQPTNTSVIEGQNAVFSLLVTNQSSVTYRWRLNGANLPGANATKPAYTVSNVNLTLNNGQLYSCVVSNSLGAITSAPALLNVLPDTVRPTLTRVFNLGTTNVQVVFSEAVEAASAANPANYVFTNGLAVTGAALGTDNNTVTLTTGPLVYGSNYWLIINRVRDRASTPNTIATNTLASFVASPYVTQDIGNSPIASVLTILSNGVSVTAAGSDIGGSQDQFSLNFQLRTGDFDLSVCAVGLSPSDVWAKAGLMARETLDAGGRFAASLATPAMNGSFFEWRDPASSASSSSGSFPANYPNTWLRLKRAANVFTGFASYDGQTWTQLGSATIAMPSQIYVGFAVSSHSAGQATTAQFGPLSNVTSAVVGTVVNPHEPLGPSSRKTPIVVSEIMYKPAPRADTNNLEFIEIYNSNPWFHDISGYQLVGSKLNYTFPAGSIIQGGAFLVIAASPQSVQNAYGIAGVLGPYTGGLKNPDKLELLDEAGSLLLTIAYDSENPWPVATSGTGHSLVLANPTYGEADPRAWDISDAVGGSPGRMDAYRPSPLRSVVINEFLAHTDPPDWDYIELYNHANQAVDISGCVLTDDASTNKFVIPAGTSIPARGFVWFSETTMHFALSTLGETIYLKSPDQSRYLDAVHFGGQENGVATGRWPDGANDWYRLSAKTPGTNNPSIRLSDIVLNELMYDPISGDSDDEYIELFNRATNSVNLSGWQLGDAVSFTFPTNTMMGSGSYLVVAHNAIHLRTNYPNLNATNCLGDFAGKLPHGGGRVTLRMPDTTVVTNSSGVVSTVLLHITVNDVTYGTGGRWGQWSKGGGSSLELIDPNSNNRLAANWGDSDETQKSSWVNIETTGVLDQGANYESGIYHAQVGLLDAGECLVDSLEVRSGTAGANLVANPDFTAGNLSAWSLQGCYSRSILETGGYGGSGYSLHIRASGRLFTGANSCQMDLNGNTLAEGQTATLRFKARWLRGWPEVLMRLNGNWLEASGRLPVPANLGTPGARNSQFVNNAGPAVYAVNHAPASPSAYEATVVTAHVHDSDGVTSLTLYYRLDPATTYTPVAMKDDGTGGDVIAKDGVFSATIPGQAVNTLVAFYLSAADSRGASTRFPALVNDGAPVRESLVMFGDGNPGGSFGVYHLWVSQTNATRWSDLSDLSNESHDCTLVSGSRAIYNMQARWAGSPYHQGFDTPYGSLCHYKWTMPDDDKFLGATSFNKLHQPGNGAGDDASIQREQLANTCLRALGVPWLNRRYVVVYVNGSRRGTLMEDTQTPDADMVEQRFPDDSNGWLYKMQPWFEFGPDPQGLSIPFGNMSWCTLMPYTTTGGVKKMARYRYMYLMRQTPTSANDFTNVYALVDAASSAGTADYVARMDRVADMENWMRVFAANHAAGNWDCFGAQNAQNLYGYVGTKNTKYTLLMFDFNIVFGNSGSWGPGENLFAINGSDSNMQAIYNEPAFRRMYWRALGELVNGPLDIAKSGPLLDAKYEAFSANGLNVENPNSSLKNWVTSARASIASQMAAENASGFTVNSTVTMSNDVAYVTGTAPFNIKTIWVNGGEYPLVWTSRTTFSVAVPVQPGTTQLSVVGVDMQNHPVVGASNNVAAVYVGTLPSMAGKVVINEIMYNPAVSGAEYVELYNNSTNITFDLSGYEIRGLGYTFPPGSVIAPTNYLVLASDLQTFGLTYGFSIPVYDTFSGRLQNGGETLTLLKPGTNATSDFVVAKVCYQDSLPWPTNADAGGTSLQLVDATRDNWRVGNWSVGRSNQTSAQWVYFSTNGTATSSKLYIYLQSAGDIYIDDLKLVAGTVPDAGANLVANGDFEASPLTGTWTVTANFSSSAVSSTVKHSGNSSLHVVATAAGAGNGNSIYQNISPVLNTGQSYALSFWYLQSTNGGPLVIRLSGTGGLGSGSLDPAPGGSVAIALATPAVANSVGISLTAFPSLWINEVEAENLTGPTNSAGQRTPWIEVYNPTTNAVWLTNVCLANNLTNLTQWSFPAGAVVNPGQFKVVFADGLTGLSTPNEPHTSFMLAAGAGTLVLSRLYNGQPQVLDYLSYTNLTANHSYGSFPDAQSFARMEFYYPTAAGTNNGSSPPLTVTINEWMAGNTNTLINPVSGKYSDWFELYNYGTNPANLAGYYLTDTLTNKFKFQIPAGYNIPPHGFLLVWADGKNTNGTPDLHVTFKLNKDGSDIGLFGVDGRAVDYLTFGAQAEDTAQGRFPDGGGGVYTFSTATPRTNNIGPNIAPLLVMPPAQTVYAGQLLAMTLQAMDPEVPPQTLTFSLRAGAPAGASITSDGLFQWTPTVGQSPSTNLITVIVTDDGAPVLSTTNSFTVMVRRPNTAPVLAGIGDQVAYPNTPLNFTASVTDIDLPPQNLVFTLGPGAPTGATISTDGTFNWVPNSSQAPSTNTITVIVADDGVPSLSDSKSFKVVVNQVNTAPVLGTISNQTVYANTLLSFTASATDSDQPPQSLTFSLGAGAPTGASITSGGVFNWTPTPAQAPSTNPISVIVRDNGVPQMSATNGFNIVVYRANTLPMLSTITNQAVYANTLLTFTASATDTDQPPQTLTFSLGAGATTGASITTNGVFTWTPTSAQAPSTNTLSVIVTDSGLPALSATNTFKVVVYRPNTVPVLGALTDRTVYANTLLNFAVSATDTDQPPQTLTFSLGAGAPTGASMSSGGVFTWTPTAAQAPSTNTLSVIVADSGLPVMSATNTFKVVVYGGNTAPVLGALTDKTVYANTLLSFTVSATDTDQPPQALTFSLGAGAPTGASMSSGGVFAWTPTAAQAPSTNTLSVVVADSGLPAMWATNTFKVVVYRANTPPLLGALTDKTVYANTLLDFTVSATDTDQPPQTLTFSLGAGAPTGASISSGGAFTWTPTAAQAPSTNTLSVIVTDSGLPVMSVTNTFKVVVYQPNTAPVLGALTDRTVYANTLLNFTVSATDTDQPPQTLTFSLGGGAPAGASISSGGVFTWTPTDVQAPSTNTITVTVTDNGMPPLSNTNSFRAFVVQAIRITSVTRSGNTLMLTWNSQAGQSYRVLFKNSLTETIWQQLGQDFIAGGPTTSATDAIGSGLAVFYRVEFVR